MFPFTEQNAALGDSDDRKNNEADDTERRERVTMDESMSDCNEPSSSTKDTEERRSPSPAPTHERYSIEHHHRMKRDEIEHKELLPERIKDGEGSKSSPPPLLSDSAKSSKDHHTSPPNVTVIQPSASHPMFSYLYPPGLYPTASHPMSVHMGHLLNGLSMHHPYFSSATSAVHSDLSHLSPDAMAALTPNMVLNGQFAVAGHPLLSQGYPGLEPGTSTHGAYGHLGHLSPGFSARHSHRYSPYSLPSLTKTTMTTSAPLAATGLLSRSEGNQLTSTSALRNSPRAASPHSPRKTEHTVTSPASELKSIERMVNGLERRPDRISSGESLRSDK